MDKLNEYYEECPARCIIGITAAVVSVVAVAATVGICLKVRSERKKIGGRLVKVNYKFTREYDN